PTGNILPNHETCVPISDQSLALLCAISMKTAVNQGSTSDPITSKTSNSGKCLTSRHQPLALLYTMSGISTQAKPQTSTKGYSSKSDCGVSPACDSANGSACSATSVVVSPDISASR